MSLIRRIEELKQEHPAWGARKIARRMQRDGWSVSYKRIFRLYRACGLHTIGLPRVRRRRLKHETLRVAQTPDDIWACDWTVDEDSRGRSLFWIAVVDECTRECLGLDVVRQVTGSAIVKVLHQAIERRGVPRYVRSDNEDVWRSRDLMKWRKQQGVGALFIRRHSPWENGVIESFFAQLTNELLRRVEFTCLRDAQVAASRWREEYNHLRSMPVLGHQTPAEAAQAARQLSFAFDANNAGGNEEPM